MYRGLKKMCEKAVVTYFKALCQHSLRWTEETSVKIALTLSETRNVYLPN